VTSAATAKHADDIVIVCAVRTAICQAKRGKFKDTHPTELLAPVLNAVCERVNLDKSVVDDILVGNVLTPGAFAVQAKMASFMAGFPQSVSVQVGTISHVRFVHYTSVNYYLPCLCHQTLTLSSFLRSFLFLQTVNRQCSSGLQAVATIAAAIQTGQIDCGIAAGVESMSTVSSARVLM
jgi:acetyl-CoA acyltransferase 1